MQNTGTCSTSFCNSTLLCTCLHHGSSSTNLSNKQTNTAFSLSFPLNRTLFSFSLHPLSHQTHFTSLSFFPNKDDVKLQPSAFNKGKKGRTTLFETDGSADEEEDDFFDFDDELDGGDDDGDEEMFLPFGQMKKWLENKPRGFGEGKVYDTSIEEKLLEEIERSRQAQIVNVNYLKNNPVKSGSNKAPEVVPSGVRVRVLNLPKKKNIHRDLKTAFNGVSGIINISPAVSGNKKTKDPVCKGFAFVDFEREVDATRFVQNFSGHNIMFGRIQKKIKCEMMTSLSQNPAHEEVSDNDSMTHGVAVPGSGDCSNADYDMNFCCSDLSLETAFHEFDDQGEDFDCVEQGEGRDNLNVVGMEQEFKHAADSISSNRLDRIRALEQKLLAKGEQQRVPKEPKGQKLERIRGIEKKPLAKGKQQKDTKELKVQKLDIPGSAKTLKIKEKALLTGVFSKYGSRTALTPKEDS